MTAEISIIMPVYNGEKYLAEAIESTLQQSYRNFEFIILLEHGTNDASKEIAEVYAKQDPRILLVRNKKREGISKSLNIGLQLAKGTYIARMDGDDVNGARRLEIQKLYLDTYPEIGICGIRHKVINAPNWIVDFHADPEQIRSDLLFFPCLRHPSIMMRKSVIESKQLYYDETLPGAEDYELYIRAARVTKITNILEDNLFFHRRGEENASLVYRDRDDELQKQFLFRQFKENLGLSFNDEELRILAITSTFKNQPQSKYSQIIHQADRLLNIIFHKNEELRYYQNENMLETLHHRWKRLHYSLNMTFKKNIPGNIMKEWRKGSFYETWMN